MSRRGWRRLGSLALVGLLVAACGSRPPNGRIAVFAASSLGNAFDAIGAAFSAETGIAVELNLAGSNTLREQIEQGARADVFASANLAEMNRARSAGLIATDPIVFARNRLTLIAPIDNPAGLGGFADLAKPGLRLVLAAPNVPAGAYSRAAIDRAAADPALGPDFAARVLANVVSEEPNVRQVAAKVILGEADAGLVYTSDARAATGRSVRELAVPDRYNVEASYPIAVPRAALNRAAADRFVAFVRGPAGRAILERHGFQPPE